MAGYATNTDIKIKQQHSLLKPKKQKRSSTDTALCRSGIKGDRATGVCLCCCVGLFARVAASVCQKYPQRAPFPSSLFYSRTITACAPLSPSPSIPNSLPSPSIPPSLPSPSPTPVTFPRASASVPAGGTGPLGTPWRLSGLLGRAISSSPVT